MNFYSNQFTFHAGIPAGTTYYVPPSGMNPNGYVSVPGVVHFEPQPVIETREVRAVPTLEPTSQRAFNISTFLGVVVLCSVTTSLQSIVCRIGLVPIMVFMTFVYIYMVYKWLQTTIIPSLETVTYAFKVCSITAMVLVGITNIVLFYPTAMFVNFLVAKHVLGYFQQYLSISDHTKTSLAMGGSVVGLVGIGIIVSPPMLLVIVFVVSIVESSLWMHSL